MRKIADHIRLERRRLVFAGLLAFAAGYALYAHVGAQAMGLPFPVFTGLFYAAAVTTAAAATTFLLPALRRLTDGIAVSRLGFAVWVVVTQGQSVAADPLASATIVVAGACVLLHLCRRVDRWSMSAGASDPWQGLVRPARLALDWLDNTTARGGAAQASTAGHPAGAVPA